MKSKKISRTLVSWIGNTDLLIVNKKPPLPCDEGPIDTLLGSGRFCETHLLFTNDPDENPEKKPQVDRFLKLMKERHHVRAYPHDLGKTKPNDLPTVYESTEEVLDKLHESKKNANSAKTQFCVNITSGTPVMGIVMFHFGWTYNAEIYSTSKDPEKTDSRALWVLEKIPWAAMDGAPTISPSEYGLKPKDLKVLKKIVAPQNCTVLITGETGAGKSVLAKAIHQWSGRKGNFNELNCAGFSDDINSLRSELFGHVKGAFTGAVQDRRGAIKDAENGTLFLDEITEMPLRLQGLLLRFLQEKKYTPLGKDSETCAENVRIIAASNRDIIEEVRQGRFREDLYYRLAGYIVRIAPLRERPAEEIERLLLGFWEGQQEEDKRKGKPPVKMSDEARQLLLKHRWPGNVRQFYSALQRLYRLSEGAQLSVHLVREELDAPVPETPSAPPWSQGLEFIPPGAPLREATKRFRRAWVKKSLELAPTKTKAAEQLDISVQTLNYYLK